MTEQDKQFVEVYIKLHDFDAELSQIANKLFHDYSPLNKEIDELRKEMLVVNDTFLACRKLADKLSEPNYDPSDTNLDKLTREQEKTSEQLIPYSDKLTDVYNIIKDLSDKMNAFYEKDEDDVNTLYDEFSSIQTAHSRNWQNNGIDILAFENEFANFHSHRDVHAKRRDTLLDFCDKTLNNYATLNLESTAIFDVWAEFLKRCQLIRAIAALQQQAIGFTQN